MLNDRAYKAEQYIGYKVNKITREANERAWNRNIQKNKKYYRIGNPLPKGLITYLVCAGPSLEKNVEELKNVGSRGIIVCIDANLEYLIDKGIIPEYCVSIDASDKIYTMVKSVIKQTKDITLVANTASNPRLVERWKGPKFFFSSIHPRFGTKSEEFQANSRIAIATKRINKGEELRFNKHYKIVFPGVLLELPCGGNVTTTAHAFCLNCLKATTVAMVGADFSWETDNRFYCGSKHSKNVNMRIHNETRCSHLNMYKKRVHTNHSLFAFKQWHEQLALQYPWTVINCTEGGILGINDKGDKELAIGFDTLKNVIKEYSPKREDKFIKTKYKAPKHIGKQIEQGEQIDPAVKEAIEKVQKARENMIIDDLQTTAGTKIKVDIAEKELCPTQ